jgi:PBP1b-binding outer membrane lipoprotein LpoB
MNVAKHLKFLILIFLSVIFLNSCGGKLPGADARKYPPNPKERVKKILRKEEVLDFQMLEKVKVEHLSLQVLMNYGERR